MVVSPAFIQATAKGSKQRRSTAIWEGNEMYPTYLTRIASAAEKACALVIDRPKDPHAREQLFDALAQVANPAFQADDPELSHLTPLFSQAQVWAAIVRTRIAGLRADKRGYPAVRAVQYPARDLLPILGDLCRELRMMPEQ